MTFSQFRDHGLKEGLFDRWLKPKKKPIGMRPYRTGKAKDSSAYRTDHHHGHGDIEPSDVPVFKPSWQNAR